MNAAPGKGCLLVQRIICLFFHLETHSLMIRVWVVACAEPDFVGSALVRESSGSKDGDDDKIYFFFSERALELDCDTELTVARVARVCKVMDRCNSMVLTLLIKHVYLCKFLCVSHLYTQNKFSVLKIMVPSMLDLASAVCLFSSCFGSCL